MAELAIRSLSKGFGATSVLEDVDMTVASGEFMVLVGPSGCGKSTLLRLVAGLDDPTSGDIRIDGQSLLDQPAAERGVAMVFQSYALYPHMTVAQNLGFALKMAGVPEREVRERVGRAAETLQLSALLDRKPAALSGGQRQRVAIGRAIVRRPKVFLFDEPLSNLDAALRVQMRMELARLHRELGTTMVYVTHDQVEAMTLGQRIAVFDQGRIAQIGAPLELFERPRNRYVAGFLGSPRMNFIPIERVAAVGTGGSTVRSGASTWQLPFDVPQQCTLGVRPEHLQPADEGGLQATVDLVERLGDVDVAYATLDGAPCSVALRLTPHTPGFEAGARVRLMPHAGHVHVFDPQGLAWAA
jgi:multiple sugar transport system ATP-binding protein